MKTPTTDTRADGRDLHATLLEWQRGSDDDFSSCGEIIPPAPDSGDTGAQPLPASAENEIATPSPETTGLDGIRAFWDAVAEIGRLRCDGYELWNGAFIKVEQSPLTKLWHVYLWHWNYIPAQLRYVYASSYDLQYAAYKAIMDWRKRRPSSRFVEVVEMDTDACLYFDANPRTLTWRKAHHAPVPVRGVLNVMAWG